MQLAHLVGDVGGAIVVKQVLIQQTVLVVVVELQSATLTTTEYGHKSFLDLCLDVDGLILLEVVVESRAVVLCLKKLDIVLQQPHVNTFLRFHKIALVSLHQIQSRTNFPQLLIVSLHSSASILQSVNFAQVHLQLTRVSLGQLIQHGDLLLVNVEIADHLLVQFFHLVDKVI